MSENSKTILFLAVAFVSTIFAFAVSREAPEKTAADEVGKPLVAIENPLDVTRMKIVKFDPGEGSMEPFEVAKVDGRFSIPSHQNHPADESTHLVDAVTGINNVEILSSVSDQAGNHEDFGVLDPTSDQLGRGAQGVGTRVTLSDNGGEDLADFIIGKKVDSAPSQYYVRRAGNDQVYTVELKPEGLSTKFEDWIERDLLKLDPLEFQDVSISDYTVITQQQPVLGADGLRVVTVVQDIDMEAEIKLRYDQIDLEWTLEKLVAFEKGNPREEKLGEDEQLNKQRLDEMKAALNDLTIVDVHRKPAGLGNSLAEFIQSNPEAVKSLEEHGFFFRTVESADGQKQNVLLSNNGEVNVGMADGLQYVLRFGNVAGREKVDETPDSEQGSDRESTNKGMVLRNLMVITQFDRRLIKKPDYQKVPDENPPESIGEQAEEEPANGESNGPTEAEKAAAKKVWQEKREDIIKKNDRLKKAYEEKIAAGEKRSADLNRRFADWYYVISDDTYRKIHLTIKDVLEKKQLAEDNPPNGLPPGVKKDPLDQLQGIVPPLEP
jgi:hypothetical protein